MTHTKHTQPLTQKPLLKDSSETLHKTTQSDNTLDELRDKIAEILPPEFLDSVGAKADDFYPAIIELVAAQNLALLTRLEAELDVSEKRASTGSRPQFSKDTETRGEAYSRTQGFKSALLVAKQKLQSERALIEKRMM